MTARRNAAVLALAPMILAAGAAAAEEAAEVSGVQVIAPRDHSYRAETTVTATKTDTPLRDVPQAVTVVTDELIRDQSMQGMADVIRYVPGVTMGQGEGHRDAPTLRGNATTADFYVDGVRDDVHQAQPAALSITNAAEYGLVYTPAETAALGALCRERGLGFHLDGARFANAVASLGCAPAELTWKAGVDALSFGFVKNGGISAEALIFFRPGLADATRYRRKRAGHLLSKGRYLAAQILAMLEGEVWLRNARAANAAAARLAEAAGSDRLVLPVQANEIFIRVSADEAAALRAKGFDFYDWGPGEARLVTSWDSDPAHVDALAAAIRAL